MSIVNLLAALVLPVLFALPADLELEARRAEATLLNRTIDLRGLRVWRPRTAVWQSQAPGPARLMVLHLWSVDCPPCVAEFPMLREITRGFARTAPEVRFVYASETLEEDRLIGFVNKHVKSMPQADVYQAADERLRNGLQTRTQPLTLLLDRNFVVRQAFVGSLAARRNELVDAIERLLKTAPSHRQEPR